MNQQTRILRQHPFGNIPDLRIPEHPKVLSPDHSLSFSMIRASIDEDDTAGRIVNADTAKAGKLARA